MKKNECSGKLNQKGVGLLEILISILIGSIMMLAITSMYGNFISSSRLQEEQSKMQDQANFAFLTLNRAVRMSGAGLCVNPTIKEDTYLHQVTPFETVSQVLDKYNLTNDSGDYDKFSAKSRLHSFTAGSAVSGTGIKPVVNSDVLLVMYSDSGIRRIEGSLSGGSDTELVPAQEGSRFHRRKLNAPRTAEDPVFYGKSLAVTWVMLSDCEHTAVLKYSNKPEIGESVLSVPDNGDFLYNFGGNGEETLIGRLQAKLYFIAKEPGTDLSQLYVRDLLSPDTAPKPLAVYAKNMKIQYRNPTTGSWVEGSARKDWSEEWPIRIVLTMESGMQLGEQEYTRILGIRN